METKNRKDEILQKKNCLVVFPVILNIRKKICFVKYVQKHHDSSRNVLK